MVEVVGWWVVVGSGSGQWQWAVAVEEVVVVMGGSGCDGQKWLWAVVVGGGLHQCMLTCSMYLL